MDLLGNTFGWVCDAVGRFTGRPLSGPRCSPFRLLPSPHVASPSALRPPPRLLRKPVSLPFPIGHFPLLLRGVPCRGGGGWPSRGFSLGSPSPSFRSARGGRGGGGGAAGASASGSGVASLSVYRISFRLYSNFFSDNLSAFSSVNYHYSIHIIH